MDDQIQPVVFKGKGDWIFYLELAAAVVVSCWGLWSFFTDNNILGLLLGIACVVITVVGAAQLLRTCYELRENGMDLRSGISHLYVDYSAVTDIDAVKEAVVSGYVPLAMGSNKLYVIFAEGDKTYRLELSPADREGFLQALRQRVEQARS